MIPDHWLKPIINNIHVTTIYSISLPDDVIWAYILPFVPEGWNRYIELVSEIKDIDNKDDIRKLNREYLLDKYGLEVLC